SREGIANSAQRDWRRLLKGISVSAGADRRKGNRGTSVLGCESNGLAVGGFEKLRLFCRILSVARSDRVDDVARPELSATGNHRSAGGAAPRPSDALLALLEDSGTSGAVNGAAAPASAHQAGVRGVDDRIDLLTRDVPAHQLDHRRIHLPSCAH